MDDNLLQQLLYAAGQQTRSGSVGGSIGTMAQNLQNAPQQMGGGGAGYAGSGFGTSFMGGNIDDVTKAIARPMTPVSEETTNADGSKTTKYMPISELGNLQSLMNSGNDTKGMMDSIQGKGQLTQDLQNAQTATKEKPKVTTGVEAQNNLGITQNPITKGDKAKEWLNFVFNKQNLGAGEAQQLQNYGAMQELAGKQPIQPKEKLEMNARMFGAKREALSNQVTAFNDQLKSLTTELDSLPKSTGILNRGPKIQKLLNNIDTVHSNLGQALKDLRDFSSGKQTQEVPAGALQEARRRGLIK